jgi:hypothetical protein
VPEVPIPQAGEDLIIYVLSSPDKPGILLTSALAAVVAAQKGAARYGDVLEIGTWDTDTGPLMLTPITMETECTTSPSSPSSEAEPSATA